MKKAIVIIIIIAVCVALGLAAGLTAKFKLNLDIVQTKTDNFGQHEIRATRGVSFADGTGADQADTLWQDSRTLADDANETLNLHDGTLIDSFGDAVTLNILKALYVRNTSTDAILLIGGVDVNCVGLFVDPNGVFKLRPGGDLFISAPDINGIDVTGDPNLRMEHDGAGDSNMIYDVIIVGVD